MSDINEELIDLGFKHAGIHKRNTPGEGPVAGVCHKYPHHFEDYQSFLFSFGDE